MSRLAFFPMLVFALVATACGSHAYVWINDVPPEQVGDAYSIASGDVISVRVFNQDSMSIRSRVRSDGKIAVPLLGDVAVRGRTPDAVSQELATRLKAYVVSPMVTVTVEEMQPTSVAVLGEVTHPGIYTVDPASGVLQALAAAGGFTEYASREGIYVVRRDPPEHIRFSFDGLNTVSSHAARFRLRPGDVVVVE